MYSRFLAGQFFPEQVGPPGQVGPKMKLAQFKSVEDNSAPVQLSPCEVEINLLVHLHFLTLSVILFPVFTFSTAITQ